MNFFHILLHLLGKKSAFLRKEQLPSLPCCPWILSPLPSRWFVTDDFKETAKNHCAAVCVMNALLYFGQNCSFSAVHSLIGNGPVFTFRKAKHWFHLHKVRSNQQLKAQLSAGRPCALLLSTPRHEWHWVFVTGYLDYPDGSCWLSIADGWHCDEERYLPLHREHDWIYCAALELK